MQNRRRIIGIGAAALLAILGVAALVGFVNSAKNKAVAKEALADVYVVDKAVPKGSPPETIKASVSVDKVPQRLVQPGVVTSIDQVGDKVASTDLQPGDQLLTARLVASKDATTVVTDKVQVSANLTAERTV